jgi:hypothetical protein
MRKGDAGGALGALFPPRENRNPIKHNHFPKSLLSSAKFFARVLSPKTPTEGGSGALPGALWCRRFLSQANGTNAQINLPQSIPFIARPDFGRWLAL